MRDALTILLKILGWFSFIYIHYVMFYQSPVVMSLGPLNHIGAPPVIMSRGYCDVYLNSQVIMLEGEPTTPEAVLSALSNLGELDVDQCFADPSQIGSRNRNRIDPVFISDWLSHVFSAELIHEIDLEPRLLEAAYNRENIWYDLNDELFGFDFFIASYEIALGYYKIMFEMSFDRYVRCEYNFRREPVLSLYIANLYVRREYPGMDYSDESSSSSLPETHERWKATFRRWDQRVRDCGFERLVEEKLERRLDAVPDWPIVN